VADAVDKDPNYWVLSIDDDPFLRLGLDSALSQTKDIEFSSAASKADGMQVFVEMWNGSQEDMKRKPSLILLDQDLQVCWGGDICEFIPRYGFFLPWPCSGFVCPD
jgi:DNA-binding NarL/FixJ family response regulator